MINLDALHRFLAGPPLITVNVGKQETHEPTHSQPLVREYPEVVEHRLDACHCGGFNVHYHMQFPYFFQY
jgi:hypothetical protein